MHARDCVPTAADGFSQASFRLAVAKECMVLHRRQQRAGIAWRRYEDQMKRDLHALAASRPDPVLTEDRAAVAAAILKGASRSEIPTGPPPDLATMSNRDFQAYTIKQHGFDPGV